MIKIQTKAQQLFLLGIVITLSLSAVMGIIAVIAGRLDPFWAKVLGTTSAIGATSIIGLAGATSDHLKGARPAGIVSIVAACLSLVFTLIMIWGELTEQSWVFKIGVTSWVAAVALALTGLVALAKLAGGWQKGIRWVTWFSYAVIFLFACYEIWAQTENDIVLRTLWIADIVAVFGTITVPILHRISAIAASADLIRALRSETIELTCPRCEAKQNLLVGKSKCNQCGLGFSISLRP